MKQKFPIDEHLKVPVNGTTLDLRIRGTNTNNPVVLFLHGGPGICDRHFVLRDQAPLTDVCTLVCLDQRGSGKSYTREQGKREMSVDQVVEDARIVVEFLCDKFRKDKIYLVGHSYGSFLGVLLCQRYPKHIAAYVGLGQLADGPENERISYEFVWNEAQKRGDAKAIADLTRIGAPVHGFYKSLDDLTVQRNYMTKFGGAAHGESESIFTSMVLPVLRSPEYTLFDLIKYANGAYYNLRQLWESVIACEFIKTVRSLDNAGVYYAGRVRPQHASRTAKAWLDALDAPKKNGSGLKTARTRPSGRKSARWNEVFREKVLAC
jgi:pimeloyl-ACP methyl ester carboxylesterase